MDLDPLGSSIRERLELLKQGKDLSEILTGEPHRKLRALLRRCAVVRTFRGDLLRDVLRRHPSPIDEAAVADDRLFASTLVEPVPWEEGAYRIVPEQRATLLGEWETE